MNTNLALDIGGTKIAGGIVDNKGEILLLEKIPTPASLGGPAVFEQSVSLLKSLRSRNASVTPSGIGISTGGQIDLSGEIIGGTEMISNWIGFPFRRRIEKEFSLPAVMLNDGHAGALAEFHFGAGRDYKSMLCVVIGTGLGGGLVIDGRLQHGSHGLAGSLGQMKVSPDGRNYISLEGIVSGPGLKRAYNERVGLDKRAANAKEVAHRSTMMDGVAIEVIETMGWWLGLGLSHALHAYDAECVVLGGSVALIGELFWGNARQSLNQHGHMTVAKTPILSAKLGPEAQLVGAAEYARQEGK